MSRVGKQPIPIPKDVTVTIESGLVTVQGKQGTLNQAVSPDISVEVTGGQVVVSRSTDQRQHRALHGLFRSLIANMITGVTEGFEKTLDIVGVGYRAQESSTGVVFQVGYSHPVELQPLEGVSMVVEGNNRVHVRGIDKQRVGEMAARIRAVRGPNAYTGKGIRYLGERVRLKPGKSAGRAK
jgi:large subunit ribosomal protein L6